MNLKTQLPQYKYSIRTASRQNAPSGFLTLYLSPVVLKYSSGANAALFMKYWPK